MRAESETFYNPGRLHLALAVASLGLLAATVWMLAADHCREWKVYQRTLGRRPAIRQYWLPELTIDYHFCRVPRFDRCTTCHLAIDKPMPDASGLPHPYRLHPRLDLFVGAQSPHPVEEFGCTICHAGQGSATAFKFASHAPNDPVQQARWEKEHGWFRNHDWEWPMRPARFAESGCLRCHHDVVDLEPTRRFSDPPAPKLLAGYHLVRENGCFGCHEIKGVDDSGQRVGPDMRLEPAGTMRKVGPSLREVAQKLDRAFLRDWIRRPSRFRPETRMPQLFGHEEHLEGATLADARRLEAVEVQAAAEYLLAVSRPVARLEPAAAAHESPSIERGKKAFEIQGCLACHKHRDFPKAQATQGPDLSNLGAKLTTPAGATWLVSWLRDPLRHSPRTRMPNPLLESTTSTEATDPAAHIAAYLLAKVPSHHSEPGRAAPQSEPGRAAPKSEPGRAAPKSGRHGPAPIAAPKSGRHGPAPIAAPQSGRHGPARRVVVDTGRTAAVLVEADLDALALEHLAKTYPRTLAEEYLKTGIPASMAGRVQGNAVELLGPITHEKKLRYVGRRTIAKRGCYGCHDIPGFEDAPPIGPALSDWGRKPESLLAFEQVDQLLAGQPAEPADDADAAFYREAVHARRREGFVWQKLRDPRSFDYRKAATKPFNEQLLMGRFSLTPDQREAIITFVLGLVAEPTAARYVPQPDRRRRAIVEGRKVLDQYGCALCHTMEMERWSLRVESDKPKSPVDGDRHIFRPSRHTQNSRETGRKMSQSPVEVVGMPRVDAEGKPAIVEGDEEDEHGDPLPMMSFTLWEEATVAGQTWPVGGADLLVYERQIVKRRAPWGGEFARLLYPRVLADAKAQGATASEVEAWGWVPPPLVHEGSMVQPEWLYAYLLEPTAIRPAAVLRMPKYNLSPDEAARLVDYFAAAAGTKFPYRSAPLGRNVQPETRAGQVPDRLDKALRLMTDRTTYCAKCHLIGDFSPGGENRTILAPNLDQVGRRIRPDYVRRWLADPKSVLPYTAMPVNFPPTGDPMGQDLYPGSSREQLEAVADLLIDYDDYMKRRTSIRALTEPPEGKTPAKETR